MPGKPEVIGSSVGLVSTKALYKGANRGRFDSSGGRANAGQARVQMGLLARFRMQPAARSVWC